MKPPERHPNCRCTYVLAEPAEEPSRLVAGIDLGAGLALGFLTVLLALVVCFGLVAIGVGGYIKGNDIQAAQARSSRTWRGSWSRCRRRNWTRPNAATRSGKPSARRSRSRSVHFSPRNSPMSQVCHYHIKYKDVRDKVEMRK